MKEKRNHKRIHIKRKLLAIWAREERTLLNMSQNELSLKTGLSTRTITNIESAKKNTYSEDTLVRLCRGLDGNFLEFLKRFQKEKNNTGETISTSFKSIFRAPYSINQATPKDIIEICKISEIEYSGIDIIPFEIFNSWYSKNPTGFTVIKDKNGSVCGNLDLLPIKKDILEQFLSGEIIEKQITKNDIFSDSQQDEIECLYIESCVARTLPSHIKDKDPGNPIAIQNLLFEIPKIVERVANPLKLKKIYAIAASDGGVEMLEHLSFKKIDNGKNRRDKHDVYASEFHDIIRNINMLFDSKNNSKLIKLLENLNSSSL